MSFFLLQILVPETFCKLLIDEKVQLLQIIVPRLLANLFSRSLILHIVVPDHFILHLLQSVFSFGTTFHFLQWVVSENIFSLTNLAICLFGSGSTDLQDEQATPLGIKYL